MLEGKELEGKIGDVGSYSVDVDDKGSVAIEIAVEKSVEGASVKNALSVSVSLFLLLEKAAKSSSATWDDSVVATLESLLGIKKP